MHLNSTEISKSRVAIVECHKKGAIEIKGRVRNKGKIGNTSGNL